MIKERKRSTSGKQRCPSLPFWKAPARVSYYGTYLLRISFSMSDPNYDFPDWEFDDESPQMRIWIG